MEELSPAEARRIALGAQGFTGRRPSRPGVAAVTRLASRLGAIQIDSVNAVVRSHYLPAFSRLGPYAPGHLDAASYRHRRLFEYWGHEASLLPVELNPLLRWRMERYARAGTPDNPEASVDGRMVRFARERRDYVNAVLEEVAARGPLAASELSDPGRGNGPWWGWADGKVALEYLFTSGALAIAGRRNFARLYDLPERVIPGEVLAIPTPPPDEARRQLLAHAAQALGVATAGDLADYFRIGLLEGRRCVAELVEEGTVVSVRVRGWKDTAYLHAGVVAPRRVTARALLSPFDSLTWERNRTERLFGFRYRLEIYTPEARRVHGYYVLPLLLGDRLVARADVRADRSAGTLRVPAAFAEERVSVPHVAAALAGELRRLAGWLGLDRVEAGARGDLAPALRRALRG
jgi:uncharacterized protein YcaQ